MKIIPSLRTLLATVLLTAGSWNSSALTWLGYYSTSASGNDPIGAVQIALEDLGLDQEITLLGKSDNATPPAGFSTSLDSLHGLLSGTIAYNGLGNIQYLTFKVGKAGPSKNNRANGFHLYAWDGGGEFNLLTDPNPDFVKQGNTISHISVWTGEPEPPTSVPDGGATVALLGFGAGALLLLTRKRG